MQHLQKSALRVLKENTNLGKVYVDGILVCVAMSSRSLIPFMITSRVTKKCNVFVTYTRPVVMFGIFAAFCQAWDFTV
jgi:hypothetical protein